MIVASRQRQLNSGVANATRRFFTHFLLRRVSARNYTAARLAVTRLAITDPSTELRDAGPLKLKPERKGTRTLIERYGSQLDSVRHDKQQHTRLQTVEIVVEETSWTPNTNPFRPTRSNSKKPICNEK